MMHGPTNIKLLSGCFTKICRNAASLVKNGTGHRQIQVILHASRALIRQILTEARNIPNQHMKRKITHTITANDFSVVL